jgi:hypothetical protein
LVLYLAVARGRLRSLAHFAVAAAAVAPAVPALLRVYSAVVAGHGRGTAVSDSCVWIAASAGVAVLGFSGLMLLERHVRLPRGFRVLLGRTLLAAAAAAVVSAALLVGGSHPLGRAERAWRDFTTNKAASPTKQHFSAGFGTTRYDVWRVAVRQFLAHPVEGVGADNFLVEYLR